MAAEGGKVIACQNVAEWNENLKTAKEANKLIVIDFTATWCPPCRFIAPIFADLAKKCLEVVFLKVDVDELQSVAEDFKVEAMPTFVFMKDGEIVDRVVGASKDEIVTKVNKHSTSPATAATATA